MKLNKYVCKCGHEFYDENSQSKCDACGNIIMVHRQGIDINVDIHLVEAYKQNGDRLRDAIRRISEDSTTRKRSNES
jgi:hypothetical protein